MRYCWINPVAAALYGAGPVRGAVEAKGFTPVDCREDHMAAVREQYRQALESPADTVVDMRCPLAAELVRELGGTGFTYPPIHPILIQCAAELSARYSGLGEVWITTPCAALRDYGAAQKLPNTTFCTWRDFAALHDISLPPRPLEASPIPPGFFAGLGEGIVSLASREEIQRHFHRENRPPARLLEALYCREGCHNGDGV